MRTSGLICVGALSLIVLTAGCGGSSSTTTTGAGDPGAAFVQLFDYAKNGQWDRSWDRLITEQQHRVGKSRFVSCESRRKLPSDASVSVIQTYDETLPVPVAGNRSVKAVQYTLRGLGQPIKHTNYLVEEKGEWRWALTRAELSAFETPGCPGD
jgi:hypothetical protein